MTRTESTEVLVVGSGIAGLSYSLHAAQDAEVVVVTKKQRAASSTNWAQGGIATVVGADDSVDLHARDTLLAGAGLCHRHAVDTLVSDGPARLQELIDWGVQFTHSRGELSLGREGGHSRRRIVHAGDLTGREIERALLEALGEKPNVRLFEDHILLEVLTGPDAISGRPRCTGAVVLDHRNNQLIRFEAPIVMLATGGFGQAYEHTTNPDIATGDGVAAAFRAGARIANLEFVQFHPTALYPAGHGAFLISEAVRGEGALLRTISGELLDTGHPLGALAPRDVVARAIDLHLKRTGDAHVMLDLTPIGKDRFEERFPGILAECLERGVDMAEQLLPVVPAAHYVCGGVHTDERGRSSLPGLYAAGEVACTGVHGANRLASNSLLEAVVYSSRAAAEIPTQLAQAERSWRPGGETGGPQWVAPGEVVGEERRTLWASQRDELRGTMWRNAGIVRTERGLADALDRIRDLHIEVERGAGDTLDTEITELRSLIETSRLVIRSALSRRESRGLHYVLDAPYRDNERFLKDTILAANPE